MERILHLSDFHLTPAFPKPEDNKVIQALLENLRQRALTIDYVIFTGDLIDARYINMDSRVFGLPEEKSKPARAKLMQESFQLAQEYLFYLLWQLDLPASHLLICCGNHDIDRSFVPDTEIPCDCRRDIKTNHASFAVWDQTVKKFCDDPMPHKTQLVVRDKFCFLFLNTNWNYKDPYKTNLCLNCSEVTEVLTKNHDLLVENIKKYGKEHNIVIMHAPFSDICEYARYPYSENSQRSVVDQIRNLFGLVCAGDKHTRESFFCDYIVGAPIDGPYITYGLHEFSEQKQHNYQLLTYYNRTWTIRNSSEVIKEIYHSCAEYLRPRLFLEQQFLGNPDAEETLCHLKDSDLLRNADIFFRHWVTLQKPEKSKAGTRIDPEGNLFEYISHLICDSTGHLPLVVRGSPNLGKSLFLNILYMNLLFDFVYGYSKYIPVYINMECCTAKYEQQEGNISFGVWQRQRLTRILEEGKHLSQSYERPICYIIDGMCQHVFYNGQIENVVEQLSRGYLGSSAGPNKFIYCIDTDESLILPLTALHRNRDAAYLLYFNPLTVNNVTSRKSFSDAISSFCELYGLQEQKNIILQNIDQLHLQSVDLEFLVRFREHLSKSPQTLGIAELYDTQLRSIIRIDEIANTAKACYLLYHVGKQFDQLAADGACIKRSVFEIIRTHRGIALLLTAYHYLEEIKSQRKPPIPKDSPLNIFYGHTECVYIRELICCKQEQQALLEFERKYYKSLSAKGRSLLTYLCGRISSTLHEEIKTRLEHERKQFQQLNPGRRDSFWAEVALRSIQISEITSGAKPDTDYIRKLLTDKRVRLVNRKYYLLYYGDQNLGDASSEKEIVYEGFDIYNTYNALVRKLSANHETALYRIELFTLCDLLQQRLDKTKAVPRTATGKDPVPSFFYSDKFTQGKNNKATRVLTIAIQLIERYLEKAQPEADDEEFTIYLKTLKWEFNNQLSTTTADEDIHPQPFYPEMLLEQCSRIGRIARIGWNIDNRMHIMTSTQYQEALGRETRETVMEHTYESYLIALLYLPDQIPGEENYSKEKVLTMLLIHDLGEAVIGDYPPFYEEYEKKKEDENEANHRLWMSGVHTGVSNLLPYLALWNEWNREAPQDITIVLAKEIEKIQMIYKLLILLKENRLSLSDDRIADFIKTKSRIQTKIGQKIYQTVVKENEQFKGLIQSRNLKV